MGYIEKIPPEPPPDGHPSSPLAATSSQHPELRFPQRNHRNTFETTENNRTTENNNIDKNNNYDPPKEQWHRNHIHKPLFPKNDSPPPILHGRHPFGKLVSPLDDILPPDYVEPFARTVVYAAHKLLDDAEARTGQIRHRDERRSFEKFCHKARARISTLCFKQDVPMHLRPYDPREFNKEIQQIIALINDRTVARFLPSSTTNTTPMPIRDAISVNDPVKNETTGSDPITDYSTNNDDDNDKGDANTTHDHESIENNKADHKHATFI